MTIREYTFPDAAKHRHGYSFVADGQQYPHNWLENAAQSDLDARGITVATLPDPVPPPPTLDETKDEATEDVGQWEQDKVNAKFKASPEGLEGDKARADIAAATDEAEVQAVLDGLS